MTQAENLASQSGGEICGLPGRLGRRPFDNLPATGRGLDPGLSVVEMRRSVWVKPTVVCEVKFTEWTRDNRLRHPVFLGLRDDKKASEVVRERANVLRRYPALTER
jgi:ATP-dependent DNA ligase